MPYKSPEEQKEYQRLWMRTRRQEFIAHYGGCCKQCGSVESLQFHHVDRTLKVDHRVWSWTRLRIITELDKCVLLCAECHKKETFLERGYMRNTHGTVSCYRYNKCRCELCRAAKAASRKLDYARQPHLVSHSDAASMPPGPPKHLIVNESAWPSVHVDEIKVAA